MRRTVGAWMWLWAGLAACEHGGDDYTRGQDTVLPGADEAGAGPAADAGVSDAGQADDGGAAGDASALLPPPPPPDPWKDIASTISPQVKELAGALCARYFDCQLQVFAGDVEGCARTVIGRELGCDESLEDVELPSLSDCTLAISTMDCSILQRRGELPDACDATLFALGDAAEASDEHEACGPTQPCVPGLACSGGSEACGTCEELADEHEPCLDFACADGLYCDRAKNECALLLDDGDDCERADQCQSGFCNPDRECDTPRLGDDCQGQCGSTYFCVEGECADGVPLNGDCRDTPCVGGLVCVDDQCVQPSECGQGELNDPCEALVLCSNNHYCEVGSFTCQRTAKAGEVCLPALSVPCAGGLECRVNPAQGNSFTCQPARRVPGATCKTNEDCDSQVCVDGVCSASPVSGPCREDGDCASGACDFQMCVAEHAC